MVVVAIGTISEGVSLTGPFADAIEAHAFVANNMQLIGIVYEILELIKPTLL